MCTKFMAHVMQAKLFEFCLGLNIISGDSICKLFHEKIIDIGSWHGLSSPTDTNLDLTWDLSGYISLPYIHVSVKNSAHHCIVHVGPCFQLYKIIMFGKIMIIDISLVVMTKMYTNIIFSLSC